MYYGHPVCWVLGETSEAARVGAHRRRGRLRPAAVVDHDRPEAIAAESFQGARPVLRRGDAGGGAGAACAHVFEGEFEFAGQEHFYLETNARAGAASTRTGRSSSSPARSTRPRRRRSSRTCSGWRSHEVTVQCLRMGGGFGGKEMQPHGYAAIAALGAPLTGRPVRLRLNRTQDITISGKRHGFHATWKVGFDDDGTLQRADRRR